MTIRSILLTAALIALPFSTQANALEIFKDAPSRPWSVIGGLGYTWYQFAYDGGSSADPDAQHAIDDGQTALGRFAIARDLVALKGISIGLELGVQSGNTMRFDIPQTTLDELGGVPIEANIKPMLDLLATANTCALFNTPVYGIMKLGIAYRRMEIEDRVSVNDLSQVGFEIQAGLGATITDRAKLALSYQGIFNGHTSFSVDTESQTGHISNIPAQNGILLTLSYTL